jgi:tetratricopeptide (TPR) repeat protein
MSAGLRILSMNREATFNIQHSTSNVQGRTCVPSSPFSSSSSKSRDNPRLRWGIRFMESSDLQQWTHIRAMNLPQWRVSVLDCASPLALSMTHDLQSGSGLPHSKTWRSYQRFMERRFRIRRSLRALSVLGMLTLLVLLTTSGLRAAEPGAAEAQFDAANKLYAQSKFAEAAAAYEQILTTSGTSPALHFNLGNAWFKSGAIGRAIRAFRSAQRLTPRDPDVRANLQFARNQVQGPTVRPSRLERGLGTLTPVEWLTLSTVAAWFTLGLLAARQLKPALAPALKLWTILAGVVTLLLFAGTGLAHRLAAPGRMAIVIHRDAAVRNSPFPESPIAFTAQDGAELRVLDSKNDWLQVTDDANRLGWIPRDAAIHTP